jgi:hypothetical protein
MAVDTCAWCGRYAGGRCTVEECGKLVCFERYLPGVTSTSCGTLIDGKLMCPEHSAQALATREAEQREADAQAQECIRDAAKATAAALLSRGVVPARLGYLEINEWTTKFWGRRKRSVRVKVDHGRGWLLANGQSGDGWSTGANGVALTVDGDLLAAGAHDFGLETLTDTGEVAVHTYGTAASMGPGALGEFASGARMPYDSLRSDRLKEA